MPALLHELLFEAAARSPDKTAIRTAAGSVTYADLDVRVAKLRGWLSSSGARPGDRVGLLADKNIDCYVGIYGIMSAGCPYVPLDRRAPADRLGYIIRDCGISVLVCTKKGIKPLLDAPAALETIEHVAIVDGDGDEVIDGCNVIHAEEIDALPAAAPVHMVDTDLAYILYTSGSTGQPKGVIQTHRTVNHFVMNFTNSSHISPADRRCFLYAFSVSRRC